MNKKKEQKLSSFMTKILRHTPLDFGIVLSNEGFASLSELTVAISSQEYWSGVRETDLLQVVSNCQKQRYEVTGDLIRARYGHSCLKLTYEPSEPPVTLIHGTATRFLPAIIKEGLKPMQRQYVHLSSTPSFASLSGNRHGELVLLEVDSRSAYQDGFAFYYAGNQVWLSEPLPATYLSIKK